MVPEALLGAAIHSGRLSFEVRGDRVCLVASVLGVKTVLSDFNQQTQEIRSGSPTPITQKMIEEKMNGFTPDEPVAPKPAPKGSHLRLVQ